jgi:hypothetical protein
MRTYPNFAVAQPAAWPGSPAFVGARNRGRVAPRRRDTVLPSGWWIMPSLFVGLALWWALITAL